MAIFTSTTPRRVFAGLIGGAVLAIAVPAMASAHVGVSPDELTAGDHSVLTFSFSHGCENSPTTALTISIPDGLTSVSPTLDGDWNIDVTRGDDGLVSSVTYTAIAPVPTDLRGAVSMGVGVDENTPDSLAFPVVQTCVSGSTEWTELAEAGEDPHDLEAPAPVVTVTADAGSAEGHAESTDVSESGVSESGAPLATALGAAGLVAALAALTVAVLAYRRRA